MSGFGFGDVRRACGQLRRRAQPSRPRLGGHAVPRRCGAGRRCRRCRLRSSGCSVTAAATTPATGTGSVTVVVHPGDSASTIGTTLAKAGVVRSARSSPARRAANPQSRDIQPAPTGCTEHMQASLAVSLLLNPTSLVSYRVTIPEGFTAAAIVAEIAKQTPISAASLKAALERSVLARPAGVCERPGRGVPLPCDLRHRAGGDGDAGAVGHGDAVRPGRARRSSSPPARSASGCRSTPSSPWPRSSSAKAS